jgi:hypothetical protein
MNGTEDEILWEECDDAPSFSSEEEESGKVYQTDLCHVTFFSL